MSEFERLKEEFLYEITRFKGTASFYHDTEYYESFGEIIELGVYLSNAKVHLFDLQELLNEIIGS